MASAAGRLLRRCWLQIILTPGPNTVRSGPTRFDSQWTHKCHLTIRQAARPLACVSYFSFLTSRLSRCLVSLCLVSRGVLSPHWPPLETIKVSRGVRLCVHFDSIVAISRRGLECYHWHLHLSVHSLSQPRSIIPILILIRLHLDERSESWTRLEFPLSRMSDDWTHVDSRRRVTGTGSGTGKSD